MIVHNNKDQARHGLIKEIERLKAQSDAAGGEVAQGFEDVTPAGLVWSVRDPVVLPDTAGLGIGKVVKYTVSGSDSEGTFSM